MVLMFKDVANFIGQEPVKVNNFLNIDIFQSSDNMLIHKYFKALFPNVDTKYYANIENYIILAESESYLHKIKLKLLQIVFKKPLLQPLWQLQRYKRQESLLSKRLQRKLSTV